MDLKEKIKGITIPIEDIGNKPNSEILFWLSQSITQHKNKLHKNSVDFIIIKALNRQNNIINIQNRDIINVFIIGNFRKTFTPTYSVAEALSEFYLETHVMPNLISVPNHILKINKNVFSKLRNGIVIYERR